MPLNPKPTPTPPYQSSSKYEPRTAVPEAPLGNVKAKSKSGCGCWFYGCFSLLVIFIGFIFAIYFGLKHLTGKIESLSSTQSVTSEADLQKFTQSDYDKVIKKVELFLDTLATAKGEPELSLNSNEINSLIAHHPELAELKGKLKVQIIDNIIRTQFSIPLDELKIVGKFINVQADWKISFLKNVLDIHVKDVELSSAKLPTVLSQELDKLNIGEEIMTNPENRKRLSDVEKIEVSQGKLTIRIKKEALPIKIDEAKSSEITT